VYNAIDASEYLEQFGWRTQHAAGNRHQRRESFLHPKQALKISVKSTMPEI
jgi:hypothetical protein